MEGLSFLLNDPESYRFDLIGRGSISGGSLRSKQTGQEQDGSLGGIVLPLGEGGIVLP